MDKVILEKEVNQILEKVLQENNIEVLNEMATMVYKRKPFYKITVFSDEGKVPHIHFYLNENDFPNKGGCINLIEPKYFSHGQHNQKLTNKQVKALIEWFNDKEEEFGEISNYQNCCREWNSNNREARIVNLKQIKIPNYELLNK